MDKTEYQDKIESIRSIHVHSERQGVMCIFDFMNFCGLPKNIESDEEELSYHIKKDCVQKKIMFYNSKNYKYSEKYSFIKEKNWSNLDYLLSYGDIIRNYYLDSHKIYINFEDEEHRKNLAENKMLLEKEDFLTKQNYQKFTNVLNCKSCNKFLSLNLKGNDYDNLKKLYEILAPNSENTQSLNLMGMLYENLYKNLQIKIDFDNKNRLKNINTDVAIIKLIEELRDQRTEEESNNYYNRIKILNLVQSSRNVLMNFSQKAFEDQSMKYVKEIIKIKNKYLGY